MSAPEPPDKDCASAVRTLPATARGLSEATAPVAVSNNAANALVAESTNTLISVPPLLTQRRHGSTLGRRPELERSSAPNRYAKRGVAAFLGSLAAGHRCHHPEHVGAGGDFLGQRLVGGLERDVLPASEKADEVPALRRPVVANRPSQHRVRRLERVEHRS